MVDTVLITGGTGLIGHQLVKHLRGLGMTVYFTSRNDAKIQELSAEGIIGIKIDLLADDSTERISDALTGIEINFLVNNARSLESLAVDPLNGISRQNWVQEYLIDVVVPYELSRRMIEKHNTRRIVNISSIYGVTAFNTNLYGGDKDLLVLQYACAKAALIQLTKNMAVQYGPEVQVNSISYGGIAGRVDEEFRQRYAELCPTGRMMRVDEVQGAVEFLLSSASSYMTGQNLVVDGGWTVW